MKYTVLFLQFLIFTLLSCSQDNKSKYTLSDLDGTWRIDSTAENLIYNKRKAINEEFFVFQDGNIRMKRIENNEEQFLNIGNGFFSGDTLITTTPNGAPGFKFVISFPSENVLQLNGCEPIGSENSPKPTFFLGKKEE